MWPRLLRAHGLLNSYESKALAIMMKDYMTDEAQDINTHMRGAASRL